MLTLKAQIYFTGGSKRTTLKTKGSQSASTVRYRFSCPVVAIAT